MKAVILAGGFGTRLRPLTLEIPKPIVPIFDRPFLYHQVELLRRVPDIDEVVLSLNYQPGRIEAEVGDGAEAGLPLRYRVEPHPLGTGGAVKFASAGIEDTVLVLNGDVLTDIDLNAVVARHRRRRARATIVLTPVDNPSAYGLVEADENGNVRRFLEKPGPNEITCDTINAGIYLLEPETFDRIPDDYRVVDRAPVFPVSRRPRRDLHRPRRSRLLARHRHPGQLPPGPSRPDGRALRRRSLPRAGGGGGAPRRGVSCRGGGRARRTLLSGARLRRRGTAPASGPNR